jgi:integrase
MRRGTVFRRCARCSRRFEGKVCANCGCLRSSWAFKADIAPLGAKRKQVLRAGFKTRAEANEALARLQTERKDGTYIEPSKVTVGRYLDQWLEGLTGSEAVRKTTLKTYDVAVRLHIKPRIGDVRLQELTHAGIKRLYSDLRQGGYAKAGGLGRPLSAKSTHNVHLCLHRALDDAVRAGLLRSNPASRAHQLPAERPEMKTWSATELRRFLAWTEDDRLFSLWRLMASTGMRRGESLGLAWHDVDLDARRLSVRQQLTRSGDKVRLVAPKTAAGRRSIALDDATVEVLRALATAQGDEKILLDRAYQDHDLVFCRSDGVAYDPDVITHQFDRAVAKAGVPRIRLHDLRHTAATLALKAGIPVKVVSQRLGHTKASVTQDIYQHVIAGMDEDAAQRIADLIAAPAPEAGIGSVSGLQR